MKINCIILFLFIVVSCKEEDPTPHIKTIPFECEGNYFVKTDTSSINNLGDFFTLNDPNHLYAFSDNNLITIDLDVQNTQAKSLNINYPIYRFSVCKNNKIWVYYPEKNNDYFSNKTIISLIDTSGTIFLSKEITLANFISTSDNGFIALNYIDVNGKYKIQISKYNDAATLIWTNEYPTEYSVSIRKMIETNSNDFIISGNLIIPIVGTIGFLLKIDNNGNFIWEKGNDFSLIYDIIEHPLNNYILTVDKKAAYVVKMDSAGNILWSTGIIKDSFYSKLLKADEGSVIYCASGSKDNLSADFLITKINSNGQVLWEKSYGGGGYESFKNAFIIPNIGYYLIGTTKNYLGTGHWGYYGKVWENDMSIKAYYVKTDFNGESCY